MLLYHVSNVLSPDFARRAPQLVFLLHQGLTLFFVLSGFLLFLGFAERLVDGRGLPNLGEYAAKRALRIWPAYAVILTITNLVFALSFVWPRGTGRLGLREYLLDLTLLHSYSPATIRTGLEVSWTLTVELTFYALLPMLAAFAQKAGRSLSGWLRATIPVAILFAVGGAGHVWATLMTAYAPGGVRGWSADWPSVVSRSLLMHADLFGLGMCAALLLVAARRGVLGARGHFVALSCAAMVVVAVFALSLSFGTPGQSSGPAAVGAGFRQDLVGAGFAALLIVVLLPATRGRVGLPARLLDLAPVRYLGLWSYSLYLWHMPVVRAMDRGTHGGIGSGVAGYIATATIVLVASVGLAAVTYLVVERPALGLRPHRAGSSVSAGQPSNESARTTV